VMTQSPSRILSFGLSSIFKATVEFLGGGASLRAGIVAQHG
jgi:hypothetical protein